MSETPSNLQGALTETFLTSTNPAIPTFNFLPLFSSTNNPTDIESIQKRIPGGARTQAFAASAFSPDTLTYTVDVARESFTFNDWIKDIRLAPANSDPRGIWSSERTMWVADGAAGKLYAYNMWTNNEQGFPEWEESAILPKISI